MLKKPFIDLRLMSRDINISPNCLATTHPELAKEWHPTKNKGLTPYDVTAGSGIKVWWRCDKATDHEWDSTINNRKRGNGCACCSGRTVVLSNCLATTRPDLTKMWHPTRNKGLTPYDVTAGSDKKVWWKCDKATDHEWSSKIEKRTRGRSCPYCSGNKVVLSNCLATTHPDLAKMWHPTRNKGLTPYDVTAGSNIRIWWKCDKEIDHEWETYIYNQVKTINCICCSGRKAVLSNCLATTHPDLAKMWHPTRNKGLTPYDVTAGSDKKVWWKCDKATDHEWDAKIYAIKNGRNCSCCAGKKVVLSNCLATTHPELTKEWHPTYNKKNTPYTVTHGSDRKVWWKCNKREDHEWLSPVSNRHKRGCPYCTLTPQSRQELQITFELKTIFKKINAKGFKTRVENKLQSLDIYIPVINLGIEYDGSYWHKNNQMNDIAKTNAFIQSGFNIIRIRQNPLKKIFENDIISHEPFNPKIVVEQLLIHIKSQYSLNKSTIQKINEYLKKKELQNEKALDRYIDRLLKGKD